MRNLSQAQIGVIISNFVTRLADRCGIAQCEVGRGNRQNLFHVAIPMPGHHHVRVLELQREATRKELIAELCVQIPPMIAIAQAAVLKMATKATADELLGEQDGGRHEDRMGDTHV